MIMGNFIAEFLGEFLLSLIPRLGAFFRWIFLRKKYSYKEILEQNWNGRIGLIFIILVIVLITQFN